MTGNGGNDIKNGKELDESTTDMKKISRCAGTSKFQHGGMTKLITESNKRTETGEGHKKIQPSPSIRKCIKIMEIKKKITRGSINFHTEIDGNFLA